MDKQKLAEAKFNTFLDVFCEEEGLDVPFKDRKFDDCELCEADVQHAHTGPCSTCDMFVTKPVNDWWYDEHDPTYGYCDMSQSWANGDPSKWADVMVPYMSESVINKYFPQYTHLDPKEAKAAIKQHIIDDLSNDDSKSNKLKYLRINADIFREIRSKNCSFEEQMNESITQIKLFDIIDQLREKSVDTSA